MSSMQEGKFEATLAEAELVEFFKELAEGLKNEAEIGGNGFGLNLEGFRKLKVSVKKQDGGYALKLKVKKPETYEEPVEAEAEGGAVEGEAEGEEIRREVAGAPKLKYKTLKKRMKEPWEAIMDSVSNDQLPPEGAARSFMDDSALMVAYTKKDKGPEYYEEYIRSVEAFREAFVEGRIEELKQAVADLERIKKACHAEYE